MFKINIFNKFFSNPNSEQVDMYTYILQSLIRKHQTKKDYASEIQIADFGFVALWTPLRHRLDYIFCWV